MKTSEQLNEIIKALSILQGSMDAAKKDKKNPFFKSTYADLTSVWEALRGPLAQNGLCVVQDALTNTEGVSVTTRVMHESGQWIETGPLIIPMGKADAHSTGKAITYGKRYGLGATLGIVAEEDDDGNAAQKAAPKPKIDVNAWIDKWKDDFDRTEIMEFLEYRSNLFGVKGVETVEELSKCEEGFLKEMTAWIAKKEANDLNKDS